MTRVKKMAFFKKLMKRDGNRCAICGELLRLEIKDPKHPMFTTLDHILPKSFGGRNGTDNLRLTHKKCNNKRGNSFP